MTALRRAFALSRKKLAVSQAKHFSVEDLKQNRRIRAIERKLKAIIEMRHTDDLTNAPTMAATPVVFYMSITTDPHGFKQKLNTLRVTGFVKQNLASTLQDDYRIDFILDRLPEETAVTPAEIYGSATPTVFAMIDFDFNKRFKLLKSIRGIFNSNDGVGSHRLFDHTIKLNMIQETESEGSFSQANIIKNGLYWIVWTTASANVPSCSFAYRVTGPSAAN